MDKKFVAVSAQKSETSTQHDNHGSVYYCREFFSHFTQSAIKCQSNLDRPGFKVALRRDDREVAAAAQRHGF